MDTSCRAAFILAGGKSTRMGSDKAFVMLDGRTLLDRALGLARAITPDVRIVGDGEKFGQYATVVGDIFPNCGPLAGIHTALRASRAELNLILAVDLPFLTPAFLQFMISQAEKAPKALVTLAHAAGGWQPLCAVYRGGFADAAEQALQAGRYKIDRLFPEIEIQKISDEELGSAGFPLTIFRNLNTPQDLTNAAQSADT